MRSLLTDSNRTRLNHGHQDAYGSLTLAPGHRQNYSFMVYILVSIIGCIDMGLTVAEIRKLIDSEGLVPDLSEVVAAGELSTPTGVPVSYTLHHGWDPVKALVCDKSWGVFNVQLLRFISKQSYDEATRRKVLSEIQLDDSHWDWLAKSLHFKSDEYDWFFIMAEGYPQGACLIYHPKPSLISTGDIFYIEYLAAAPWNRANPMRERSIKGVATNLLKYVVNYAQSQLKLRYGFSLHALQRAVGFYESIGMVNHPQADKESLPYFEMPEDRASIFATA